MRWSEPYRDNPYGKIKGDKAEYYFKALFDEAKLHKTDDGYILYGRFTTLKGVTPAFGDKMPVDVGLCEMPIYIKEYTLRQSTGKKDGSGKYVYEDVKYTPSKWEVELAKHIENNPAAWTVDKCSLSGSIEFYPDDQFSDLAEVEKTQWLKRGVKVTLLPDSGNLPPLQIKTQQRKSDWGTGKGATLEEKEAFVKKDLAEFLELTEEQAKSYSIGVMVLTCSPLFEDKTALRAYLQILGSIIS